MNSLLLSSFYKSLVNKTLSKMNPIDNNFQVRHPRCVVQNYKYKQYTVKHNSMILLRHISYAYIVLFDDVFWL